MSYEPLGFVCPTCKDRVANPRAVHPRSRGGGGKTAEFKNLVLGDEVRECERCRERAR